MKRGECGAGHTHVALLLSDTLGGRRNGTESASLSSVGPDAREGLGGAHPHGALNPRRDGHEVGEAAVAVPPVAEARAEAALVKVPAEGFFMKFSKR